MCVWEEIFIWPVGNVCVYSRETRGLRCIGERKKAISYRVKDCCYRDCWDARGTIICLFHSSSLLGLICIRPLNLRYRRPWVEFEPRGRSTAKFTAINNGNAVMDYLEEVKILATNFTCGEGGNNNKKDTESGWSSWQRNNSRAAAQIKIAIFLSSLGTVGGNPFFIVIRDLETFSRFLIIVELIEFDVDDGRLYTTHPINP